MFRSVNASLVCGRRPRRGGEKAVNQRDKGCRGEREFRDVLRDYGYKAERGQQRAGGSGSPDVVHDVRGVHFEVKRTEALRLWEAYDQANRDAADKLPVVVHRPSRRPWLAIMDISVFFQLLREAGR